MSNENSVKLQKFYMEFEDSETGLILQYQQENIDGDGLEKVILPFDPAKLSRGHVKMRLYHSDAKFPIIVDGFKKVQYIIFGDDPDPALKEWKMTADSKLSEILPSYFEYEEDQSFPKMTYSDVTEQDMFGEPPIESLSLSTDKGGIWAWHGLRKFKIKVTGLDFEEFKNAADIKHKATLYWFKRDNDDIVPIFENNLRYNLKGNYYTAYINTNELGAAMERAESEHPVFSGRFEIHISQHRYKQVYTFPINICVHKTTLDEDNENPLIAEEEVSIDFGTSSTCAAIQGTLKKELITLSGEGKRDTNDNDNAFENPTNLMLYTWSEFYNQWRKDNVSLPFLMTKLKDIDDVREVDYDSGYTVDDVFKEVIGGDDAKGRLKMQAILTQLKMIPYLIKHGRELSLYPLNDQGRPKIFITDDVEQEDQTHLNPIAFYGYLISRAINNPAKKKIYKDYRISMPVKFEEGMRENICKSLEYGIRRGLPRPIAEAVDEDGESLVTVESYYVESVACIGAVIGDQLKIDETTPEAKLFAVFDLGGGTLDLSYGMFRNSEEEELMLGGDKTIQIFGVGGNETVGGEKLIHKIAYKIYCDNSGVINEHDIVFELPIGELEPSGFKEGLFTNDDNSAANLSIMKEKIARKLFIYGGKEDETEAVEDVLTKVLGEDVVPSGRNAKITLRDRHGEEQEVTLKIEDIEDFIKKEIRNIIEKDFKLELEEVFSNQKNIDAMKKAGISNFSIDKVAIFLGGNASKQHFIKETLQELFPNNTIVHIGDNGKGEGESYKYKLTCKSAVAFGQLKLGEVNIINPENEAGGAPFPFYVGYVATGSSEFVKVIDKHGSDNEWKKANVVTRDKKTALAYTDSPSFESLMTLKKKVKVTDDKKRMLYIRIAPDRHNCIEYRLGGLNESFSADEPLDPEKVIELKDLSMR